MVSVGVGSFCGGLVSDESCSGDRLTRGELDRELARELPREDRGDHTSSSSSSNAESFLWMNTFGYTVSGSADVICGSLSLQLSMARGKEDIGSIHRLPSASKFSLGDGRQGESLVVGSIEVLGKDAQVGLRRTRTPRSADPKPEEKGEESPGLPSSPFFGLWVDGGGST